MGSQVANIAAGLLTIAMITAVLKRGGAAATVLIAGGMAFSSAIKAALG